MNSRASTTADAGLFTGANGPRVLRDCVFHARRQWHTFWNAGGAPAALPKSFHRVRSSAVFSVLAELVAATGAPNPGVELAGSDLPERFAIEFKP